MILTLIFYLAVCVVFYLMWYKSSSSSRISPRTYSRSVLLSQSNISKVPSDWRSVDAIKSQFKKESLPKPQRYRQKPLNKPQHPIFDDKENMYSFKPKQTLGNFILKELENSVSELTKQIPEKNHYTSPMKDLKSSILNPYAEEFTITNR